MKRGGKREPQNKRRASLKKGGRDKRRWPGKLQILLFSHLYYSCKPAADTRIPTFAVVPQPPDPWPIAAFVVGLQFSFSCRHFTPFLGFPRRRNLPALRESFRSGQGLSATSTARKAHENKAFRRKPNEKSHLLSSRKWLSVEAAGIEPASRSTSMLASTCVAHQLLTGRSLAGTPAMFVPLRPGEQGCGGLSGGKV